MAKFLLGGLFLMLCATTTFASNEEYDTSSNYDQSESLYSWCNDATRELKDGLRRSYNLVQSDQLTAARNLMVATLTKAGSKYNAAKYPVRPMTKRLIERGLKYLEVTTQLKWAGDPRFKLISQLNFMSQYIELIIETEQKLDRPYHIPYHYECRRNCHFSIESYEAAFVEQMREELNFVTDSFTTVGSNNRYVPIGSAEIFLKVSEALSAGVARDLSANLFAYQNSCSVVDLNYTARILKQFNWNKDRTYYTSQAQAVHEVTVDLANIAENLYPNSRRYYRDSNIYGGYGVQCMN